MNDINAVKPLPLPVWDIIRDAFVIPWQQKRQFFRTLTLPILLLMLIDHFVGYITHELSWLTLLLLYAVPLTLIAVPCHRLVLIGDDVASYRFGIPMWSWRETCFLGWSLLVSLCMYVLPMLAMGIFRHSFWVSTDLSNYMFIVAFPIYAGIIVIVLFIPYLSARCSLILPATAIDQRTTFAAAWNLATDNGWRLTIVISILPLGFCIFGALFPYDSDSMILSIVVSIISYPLMIIEITTLSLAYKFLSKFSAKKEAAIILF